MELTKGSFRIQAGTLVKFRSYAVNKLNKSGFTVRRNALRGNKLEVVGVRGNRILHYFYENLLRELPFAELFGWAARVRIVLTADGKEEQGGHTVYLTAEPASNELDPLAEYSDATTITEQFGEDRRCRAAFEWMAETIRQSPYFANKPNQGVGSEAGRAVTTN